MKKWPYFYCFSIVAKLSWKKFLYGKKSFILKFFFIEKNFFYKEKYKWKCKNIHISFEKYIFMQKIFVLQIKYKSFLNVYSFCKKNLFWS